jgi:hypothetical protein
METAKSANINQQTKIQFMHKIENQKYNFNPEDCVISHLMVLMKKKLLDHFNIFNGLAKYQSIRKFNLNATKMQNVKNFLSAMMCFCKWKINISN